LFAAPDCENKAKSNPIKPIFLGLPPAETCRGLVVR
jgi:hypothetical protein